jgi:hypothetical protein
MRFRRSKVPREVEFDTTFSRLSIYSDAILRNIQVVIDIGVSDGRFISATRELFPLARLICKDQIDDYQNITDFEYENGLIGNKCEVSSFSVASDLFTSSQLYPGIRSIQAQQFRMECLLRDMGIAIGSEIFVKIDSQGMDLICLRSFGEYLPYITLAIIEIQMKPYTPGMKYFTDSIAEISELGFEVCEFLNPINRSLDSSLGQIDLLIAPKTSKMMEDIRW